VLCLICPSVSWAKLERWKLSGNAYEDACHGLTEGILCVCHKSDPRSLCKAERAMLSAWQTRGRWAPVIRQRC
jgi:hypothetical protein